MLEYLRISETRRDDPNPLTGTSDSDSSEEAEEEGEGGEEAADRSDRFALLAKNLKTKLLNCEEANNNWNRLYMSDEKAIPSHSTLEHPAASSSCQQASQEIAHKVAHKTKHSLPDDISNLLQDFHTAISNRTTTIRSIPVMKSTAENAERKYKSIKSENSQLVKKLQEMDHEKKTLIRVIDEQDSSLEGLKQELADECQINSLLSNKVKDSLRDQKELEVKLDAQAGHIETLSSRVQREKELFLTEIGAIVGISSLPFKALQRLGIPTKKGKLVDVRNSDTTAAANNPTSQISSLYIYGKPMDSRQQFTDHLAASRYVMNSVIKIVLILEGSSRPEDWILVLWNLYGNLKDCTLAIEDQENIALPLLYLGQVLSSNRLDTQFSEFGFWTVCQIICIVLRWNIQETDLEGFILEPQDRIGDLLSQAGWLQYQRSLTAYAAPIMPLEHLNLSAKRASDRFPVFLCDHNGHKSLVYIQFSASKQEVTVIVQISAENFILWHDCKNKFVSEMRAFSTELELIIGDGDPLNLKPLNNEEAKRLALFLKSMEEQATTV